MSETKHSPGPWWYDKDRCAICYRLPVGHPERWSDDPEMDDGVRDVVSLISACGGTDSDADVALMTAAPVMLAALRNLLAVHRAMQSGGAMPADVGIAFGAAEAALAAAEGLR